MNKSLYVYDKNFIRISKHKVIKETEKQYKIDYHGENLLNSNDEYCHINFEWISKLQVNSTSSYLFQKYYFSTDLKTLYILIQNHLEEQKLKYEQTINFLSTIKEKKDNE